jgi:hypothetical protein
MNKWQQERESIKPTAGNKENTKTCKADMMSTSKINSDE